jgi:hypothetical protein
VFTARHHRRPAVLCALACTVVMAAAGGTAFARPAPEDVSPANSSAQAQEAYYQSYGEPQPVSSPAATPPFDDTEWLVIGLACIAAIGIAGATASQVHRIRVRRRRTTRPAL